MSPFHERVLDLARRLNKAPDGTYNVDPDKLEAVTRRILTPYDSEETRNPDGVAIARAFRAAYKSRP